MARRRPQDTGVHTAGLSRIEDCMASDHMGLHKAESTPLDVSKPNCTARDTPNTRHHTVCRSESADIQRNSADGMVDRCA
eukprot:2210142-Rhodomonas_salina.3